MKLLLKSTNTKVEADILKVESKEFVTIQKSKNFVFDWNKEKTFDVFKIITLEDNVTHGLLSVSNLPAEYRIHINLIENTNENKGKNKKYDFVAGCLLAYACQIAFEKGYLGFVSLVPKTELIQLYVENYGFSQYGQQLAIERTAAINLIKKYL